MEFSQKKFLTLNLPQQHKKCSQLLKCIYSLENPEQSAIWTEYHQFLEWMGLDDKLVNNKKQIADRFHMHLKEAGLYLRENNLLPQVKKGDKEITHEETLPIAIYLDNLRSAHNVGSIIRTTEAMSLGTLHFSHKTPYIDQKQVQVTSMGTHKWIACHAGSFLSELPRPIILLETSDQAVPISDFIFPEIFTLVVGNEEYGCSDEALELADIAIEIPLSGRKNSLNVANAFAVAAYEIRKQRIIHE